MQILLIRDTNGCHCRRYGKLIILVYWNFQTSHALTKKKVWACVIFWGLLKFVCYLPFGFMMKKNSCEDCFLGKKVMAKVKQAQRATYHAPEYNVPPFWQMGKGRNFYLLISLKTEESQPFFSVILSRAVQYYWFTNILQYFCFQYVLQYVFPYCNMYCVLSLISFDFKPVWVQYFFFRNSL